MTGVKLLTLSLSLHLLSSPFVNDTYNFALIYVGVYLKGFSLVANTFRFEFISIKPRQSGTGSRNCQ